MTDPSALTVAGPVFVIDRSAHSAPPLTPGMVAGAAVAVCPAVPADDPYTRFPVVVMPLAPAVTVWAVGALEVKIQPPPPPPPGPCALAAPACVAHASPPRPPFALRVAPASEPLGEVRTMVPPAPPPPPPSFAVRLYAAAPLAVMVPAPPTDAARISTMPPPAAPLEFGAVKLLPVPAPPPPPSTTRADVAGMATPPYPPVATPELHALPPWPPVPPLPPPPPPVFWSLAVGFPSVPPPPALAGAPRATSPPG